MFHDRRVSHVFMMIFTKSRVFFAVGMSQVMKETQEDQQLMEMKVPR